MASLSQFMERFRRITYSGRYLPEVDGLRFIGVVLVILFVHMGTYIHDAVLGKGYDPNDHVYHFFYEGGYGIYLFFMVSGFILAMPFAEQHLLGSRPVHIGKYFGRRITRIEPAYIVSLIVYFALRVWVLQYESFHDLFPHFLASFFYLHNFIYDAHSTVNAVAWTLEVEVQFYILAPLLGYIYLTRNPFIRRGILILLIVAGCIYSFHEQYEVGNILSKGCYFLCGMLLAELYLLRKRDYNENYATLIGASCFIISLFVPSYYVSVYWCLLKMALTFIFFFYTIHNSRLKKWLSYPPVAIIGGMCYSVYLVHQGVLGLLRHDFAKIVFVQPAWLNATVHYIIAGIFIFTISGIFFLLVEKPTMKRNWYKFSRKAK